MSAADLIARLEAATEGNAALDNEIWNALPACGGRSSDMIGLPGQGYFSRSLDAARTIVPEGWVLEIIERDPNKRRHAKRWVVILMNFSATSGAADVEAAHDNPCLALCAAALKARAATPVSIPGG